MTRVVQLQYSTKSAGSSALRLHHAFIQANIESSIISLQADINAREGVFYLGERSRWIARLDAKVQSYLIPQTIKKFGMFSYPVFGTNVAGMKEIKEADVIYIHWILMGFLNINSFSELAKLKKPVIIVMHDMWAFTGGCHYSFTCEKFKTGCSECQMFTKVKKKDLSSREFSKKAALFAKYSNFYFISPSRWLFNSAKSSYLLKDKPLFYLPNIIDNTLFKPFDTNIAKGILNIGIHETVIAFGAVSVDSPYKGRTFLQKALEIIKQKNITSSISILIFGSEYKKLISDEMPFKTYFMGRLNDDYSINIAYNAADVFVAPSSADNQPTTVIESMCCGTPVVGFDVGGIPDMIVHKKNGYLAKYMDSEDLAEGIMFCINNHIKGKMLPIFEKKEIIKKHLELINQIQANH